MTIMAYWLITLINRRAGYLFSVSDATSVPAPPGIYFGGEYKMKKLTKTQVSREACDCAYCRGETRPEVHDDDEFATDQVLKDMALQNAMDEFDID